MQLLERGEPLARRVLRVAAVETAGTTGATPTVRRFRVVA